MAKIAVLQVVVAVAEYEDFVIYCYFRPLFVQNGGNKVPFLPLSILFQGHTLETLREGWRLHCGS